MKSALRVLLGGFLLSGIASHAQTGNVGIGTPTPSDQLHTTGTVRFQKYSGAGTRLVEVDSAGRLVAARDEAVYSNPSPLSIPDAGCTGGFGVNSALTITGQPLAVPTAGIAVQVDITHTFTADLRIFLEAPNGAILNLAYAVGGGDDNFSGTIFSDEAALSIASGTAPFSGSYKPQGVTSAVCAVTPTVGTFGAIGGGSVVPNGVWRLRVFDATGVDTGSLNSWSISFGGASSISTAAENGAVPFFSSGGLEASKIFSAPSGNVGVRTTAPTAALDVAGSLRLRSGVAAPGKVLTALDSAGNAGWVASAAGLSNTYVLSKNGADAALLGAGYGYNSKVLLSTQTSYSTTVPAETSVRCSYFLKGRNNAALIPVGSKFIIFGGSNEEGSHSDGAIYDPVADTWTAIPDMADGVSRSLPVVVWAGSKLVVWGGMGSGSAQYHNSGKIFDTTTSVWTAMPTAGAPSGRYTAAYGYNAATNEMVVWGGQGVVANLADGARFNLTTNTWSALPAVSAPSARSRMAFACGGGKLFVCGGYNTTGATYLSSAHLYDFASNTWTTLPVSGLAGRYVALAEHTGTGFIVWGGLSGTANFNDGAVYTVGSNTWAATSTNGAPSYSTHESAFYNGNLIVSAPTGSYRYNLAAGTWNWLQGFGSRVSHVLGANTTGLFVWGGKGDLTTGSFIYNYGERYFWASQSVSHQTTTPLELHLYKKN